MTTCSLYKLEGAGQQAAAAAWGQAGHRSVVVSNCFSFALLVFLGFYFSLFLLFSSSLQIFIIIILFYFNYYTVLAIQEFSHFYFSDSLSHPTGVGGQRQWLCGAHLLGGIKTQQTLHQILY